MKDIWPGSTSSSGIYFFAGHDEHVYFAADDGSAGHELWRSDGTEAGTTLVADIAPGAGSSYPSGLTVLGDRLVFFADDGSGRALWESDGTTAGTRQIFAIPAGYPTNVLQRISDTELAFWIDDRQSSAVLWKTDGTTAGTTQLRVYDPNGFVNQRPAHANPGATTLVFAANDAVIGNELWLTDGSVAGTRVLADISPTSSDPTSIVRLGNRILFAADDGLRGAELHAIDLTATGDYAAEVYGSGCPGTGGLVPEISLMGEPRAAAGAPFSIVLDDALPATVAAMFLGFDRQALSLGGGCRLRVAPPWSPCLCRPTPPATPRSRCPPPARHCSDCCWTSSTASWTRWAPSPAH